MMMIMMGTRLEASEVTRLYISWHNPEATSANCRLFPNVDFNMIADDPPQNDDDYNPESHNDDKINKFWKYDTSKY